MSLDVLLRIRLGLTTFEIESRPMNPFTAYGIQHLSPSSCNLFASSPAMFVLQKCMGGKFPVGAAAHRGTAVEAGIVYGLMNGADDAECIKICETEFNKLTALSGDSRRDKEAAAIGDMVKMGLSELRPYGKPTETQGKIEYHVEGLAVPLIGFFDIEWANHGILTDIKTTHALPSKISTSHARQVALYRAARGHNLDARVTYVTPKKSATYHLENVEQHVEALTRIALTIQNFLSVSDDAKELAKLVVPEVDSFYFADPLARKTAFDVWGL